MTIGEWLDHSQRLLTGAAITTARLDVLVLLADELREDKSWILAHSNDFLRGGSENRLNKKIIQRSKHTPLAYIRGHAEFYGREFLIDTNVLVPRPESESIISLLKHYPLSPAHTTIIDVGTGSGCLAITAKLETNAHHVFGCDISKQALRVAQKNASQFSVEVGFIHGDLLAPVSGYIINSSEEYVVVANLPYVPTNYPINEAAKYEPPLALFSEDNGLNHYSRLFTQIDAMLIKPAVIITEALAFQHSSLRTLAEQHNYGLNNRDGLAQAFNLRA